MIYDSERTRSIVNRLVLLGNNLRGAMALIFGVVFAGLLGIFGVLVYGPLWWLFTLLGVIVGVVIGIYLAGAVALLLEWMAQMLIAIQPEERRIP
jgi:hypothetical protein